MCGICGVVTAGPQPSVDLVRAMMARLGHRGPDDSGCLRDDRAALGHTRLAIIDAEGGRQPMCNEDGTVWVVFNGEIFNYVELAAVLAARGHRFASRSDTEVIVHAWEEWGVDCFNRFNGQWALAIWDRNSRELVISRDKMGVHPLFYRLTPGRFVFASEIKALFADPAVPRELDPAGLAQSFTQWSPVAPLTSFRGVWQLQPGHVAVFDGYTMRNEPYWSLDFPRAGEETNQDLAANATQLREALVASTRLRFERSDVPVGAYLSGGIDSAVAAAAIREFTSAPLSTFSVRFTDNQFDEGAFQREMVRRLETDHHEVEVSARDIAGVFPDVVWHAEAPLLRTAPAPMYLLSQLVRANGCKVVVTGEGADELLGGYDLFREAKVREFWARDPSSALRDRATELLYPWMVRNPGAAPAFARAFFGQDFAADDPAASHRTRWNSSSALLNLLSADWQDAIAREAAPEPTPPRGSERWDSLSRAQWFELTTLLPGYLLASQGDRMLMSHSVEGRFPFLDPTVVDLANALPARHKLFGLEEKFVLRQAFADLVPHEILHRPKQPYRAPDAASFFADGGSEWLDDVVSPASVTAAGVFDPARVSSLIAKARRRGPDLGNTDNMRVVAVISTQLLHAQFVSNNAGGPLPPAPKHTVDLVHASRE